MTDHLVPDTIEFLGQWYWHPYIEHMEAGGLQIQRLELMLALLLSHQRPPDIGVSTSDQRAPFGCYNLSLQLSLVCYSVS